VTNEKPAARVQWVDITQMLVGAMALAFPVATAEEIWNLGTELSTGRLLALQIGAMTIIGFYVFHAFDDPEKGTDWKSFFLRTWSIYFVTFFACALLLWVVNRFPFDDLGVALGRTVVVAFPAAFAATIFSSR